MRIGTQPWIGYGPWWIAQEQGLFAETRACRRSSVDFVTGHGSERRLRLGRHGRGQRGHRTRRIKLFANGVDLRVVLVEDASYDGRRHPGRRSAIATIADLKGKTVAYEEGSTSDLLLNYALGAERHDAWPTLPAGAHACRRRRLRPHRQAGGRGRDL